MNFLKRTTKSLLQKFGYDIVTYDPNPQKYGIDNFEDLKFFLNGISHPTFFDIGANKGQSIIKMKHHFSDCKIFSFEPSPQVFKELLQNSGNYQDVSTHNCGIGSTNSELVFFENSKSEMSSFLKQGPSSWGESAGEIKVPVTTIDSFCAQNNISSVDYIKSDTQGFEMQVLLGAKELMSQNRIKLIYFEIIFTDMYENMTSFDKVFKYMIDNNFSLVTFYKPNFRGNVVSWNDALFINNEYLKTINT